MITVRRVITNVDWSDFIELQWDLYCGDKIWVPPLKSAVRDILDVNKNPFFRHASMCAWIALNDGRRLGRVACIVDDRHNGVHGEDTAFFGFFECVDDQAVAQALMDAAFSWALERGMKLVRGPASPSTNHECGLLIEGFEDPPAVMMTYNPPYYAKLVEGCGFRKAKDLLAYALDKDMKFSDKLLAQAEKLKLAGHITFRSINTREFDREVGRMLEIYNDAWEANWGFVPMDEREFRHMAREIKMIFDPRLILIAEVKGAAAGFALTLPDVNQAFAKVRDGKLFPTGLLKLLWHLKGPFKHNTVNRVRILTLGIRRAYRELGLGPMFYVEYFRRGQALGYERGEASWILEDNKPMNAALRMMGARKSKIYRIYDRPLI